jgi:hypothetical protein
MPGLFYKATALVLQSSAAQPDPSLELQDHTPFQTHTPTKPQITNTTQHALLHCSHCGRWPRLCQPRVQPGPPIPRGRPVHLHCWPPFSGHPECLCHHLCLQPGSLLPQWCFMHLHCWFFDSCHSRCRDYLRLQPGSLIP